MFLHWPLCHTLPWKPTQGSSSFCHLDRFCFLSQKLFSLWVPLIAQLVKNLPAMQETLVWFLGQEDPLEKAIATHSSILAWRIPWTILMHNPFGIFQIVNIYQNCDMFYTCLFSMYIYDILSVHVYLHSPSQASAIREPWPSRCSSWF